MLLSRPTGFGFSLNPLHYVKKAAVAAGHGVAAGGKFVAHHAVDVAKIAALPVVELNKIVLQPILHVALTPVRHKVDTLKNRRAKKLAWDRRKSTTPTPQESAEAKGWAKSYLKKEVPPFGLMLSLLAGATPGPYRGPGATFGNFGDPTTATIVASVPTLLAIIDKILTRSNKNGEAPNDPSKGGGAPTAPAAPGTVDLTPIQDQAAAAGGGDAAAGGDAGADAGGGKHGGGGGAKIMGLPKKYVVIGGAVLGGVLVLSLLTSKKG